MFLKKFFSKEKGFISIEKKFKLLLSKKAPFGYFKYKSNYTLFFLKKMQVNRVSHLRELWQLECPGEHPVVELLRVPLPDDVPVRVHHEQVGDPGVGLQGGGQHHGTDLHVLAAVVDGLEGDFGF